MELATVEDISRLESKIDELKTLFLTKPIEKSLTMSVSKVRDEYGLSEYTQRNARNNGGLSYRLVGYKDIEYDRTAVEQWLDKKIIKPYR